MAEGSTGNHPDDLAAAFAAVERAGSSAATRAQELVAAAQARGEELEREGRERAGDLELQAMRAVDGVLDRIAELGERLDDTEQELGGRTGVPAPALPLDRMTATADLTADERRARMVAASAEAGSVVRERCDWVVRAVEEAVAQAERTALTRSDERRREAEAAAVAAVHATRLLESELTSVLRGVGRATDLLRLRLDEARLRREPEPATPSDGIGPAARPDADPLQQADVPSPEGEGEASPEQLPTSEPEPGAAGEVDQAGDARRHVAGKPDLELAELYEISTERSKSDPEADAAYWVALAEAVVEEAVVRPAFGEVPNSSAGRRAGRRHRKAVAPLVRARAERIAESSPDVDR